VPAPLLLWITLAVAALAVALPFIGPLARIFGLVALPAGLLSVVLAVVAVYCAATEWAKGRFDAGGARAAAAP